MTLLSKRQICLCLSVLVLSCLAYNGQSLSHEQRDSFPSNMPLASSPSQFLAPVLSPLPALARFRSSESSSLSSSGSSSSSSGSSSASESDAASSSSGSSQEKESESESDSSGSSSGSDSGSSSGSSSSGSSSSSLPPPPASHSSSSSASASGSSGSSSHSVVSPSSSSMPVIDAGSIGSSSHSLSDILPKPSPSRSSSSSRPPSSSLSSAGMPHGAASASSHSAIASSNSASMALSQSMQPRPVAEKTMNQEIKEDTGISVPGIHLGVRSAPHQHHGHRSKEPRPFTNGVVTVLDNNNRIGGVQDLPGMEVHDADMAHQQDHVRGDAQLPTLLHCPEYVQESKLAQEAVNQRQAQMDQHRQVLDALDIQLQQQSAKIVAAEVDYTRLQNTPGTDPHEVQFFQKKVEDAKLAWVKLQLKVKQTQKQFEDEDENWARTQWSQIAPLEQEIAGQMPKVNEFRKHFAKISGALDDNTFMVQQGTLKGMACRVLVLQFRRDSLLKQKQAYEKFRADQELDKQVVAEQENIKARIRARIAMKKQVAEAKTISQQLIQGEAILYNKEVQFAHDQYKLQSQPDMLKLRVQEIVDMKASIAAQRQKLQNIIQQLGPINSQLISSTTGVSADPTKLVNPAGGSNSQSGNSSGSSSGSSGSSSGSSGSSSGSSGSIAARVALD